MKREYYLLKLVINKFFIVKGKFLEYNILENYEEVLVKEESKRLSG